MVKVITTVLRNVPVLFMGPFATKQVASAKAYYSVVAVLAVVPRSLVRYSNVS